jgi:hypothetical protein
MGKTLSSIQEYATIAFTLLGILFGMVIMTFIFSQLGPDATGLTVADIGYNESIQIQNNSLQSIQTYTEGSDTQFTTISIAIILVILIGVFLLFWKIFVAKSSKKSSGSASGYGGNFG